jgi:hypothetical protein
MNSIGFDLTLHGHKYKGKNKQNKLRGLSPQRNYTDRATAACRRSYSKCHVTSNKAKSNLECAEVKFQTRG